MDSSERCPRYQTPVRVASTRTFFEGKTGAFARVHELLGKELSLNGLDSMHRGVFLLTGIILAGGKSSRMLSISHLNSNVERLSRELNFGL